MDCNIEYLPPECTECLDEQGRCVTCPPEPKHLCENAFWNKTLVTDVWTSKTTKTDLTGEPVTLTGSLENDYEIYYSPQNVNGNYDVFLDNNFVGGSMCFGYILSTSEQDLQVSEGAFHRQSISACTNGEAWNIFTGETKDVFKQNCSGRMPTNGENHYKVLVGKFQVQITSYS